MTIVTPVMRKAKDKRPSINEVNNNTIRVRAAGDEQMNEITWTS
jgi:hypothetical protein